MHTNIALFTEEALVRSRIITDFGAHPSRATTNNPKLREVRARINLMSDEEQRATEAAAAAAAQGSPCAVRVVRFALLPTLQVGHPLPTAIVNSIPGEGAQGVLTWPSVCLNSPQRHRNAWDLERQLILLAFDWSSNRIDSYRSHPDHAF